MVIYLSYPVGRHVCHKCLIRVPVNKLEYVRKSRNEMPNPDWRTTSSARADEFCELGLRMRVGFLAVLDFLCRFTQSCDENNNICCK